MAVLWAFPAIFCQLYDLIPQNWGWDGHFEVLNRYKPWLIENLWLKNGHFFANYMKVFHKTEVETVILRYLVCLYLSWIKSYDIILVKKKFLHAWKCIILGLVCRSEFYHLPRKPALKFSKWLFFQNSLELSSDT